MTGILILFREFVLFRKKFTKIAYDRNLIGIQARRSAVAK